MIGRIKSSPPTKLIAIKILLKTKPFTPGNSRYLVNTSDNWPTIYSTITCCTTRSGCYILFKWCFKMMVVSALLKYVNYVRIYCFIINKLAICYSFCVHVCIIIFKVLIRPLLNCCKRHQPLDLIITYKFGL